MDDREHAWATELESAYASHKTLYDILSLIAVALEVPLKDLQTLDFRKLVGMAQQSHIEALRFAACRHAAKTMPEEGGEKEFIKRIDEYRKEWHKELIEPHG